MAAQEAKLQPDQPLADLSDYHFTGNDYTVERKRSFIQGLIDTHTVFRAATIAGISKKTAYLWAEADPAFNEAWVEALESSSDELESCMFERAKEKDTLAGIFLLKKYRPEFRDRVMVDLGEVQGQIEQLIDKLGTSAQQLLPPTTTDYIDTGYSQVSEEYIPASTSQTMRFSHLSNNQQKED